LKTKLEDTSAILNIKKQLQQCIIIILKIRLKN